MNTRARIAVAAAMLTLAACSGGNSNSAPSSPAAGVSSDVKTSEVPDVSVLDVVTGEKIALRSIVPGDKPTLLWFWAPH